MFARVLKYNPYHDELGRFTTADGAAAMAANPISVEHLHEIYREVSKPDGGFTYQPVTEHSPTKGFAVSPYPERSFAKPVKDFTFSDLVDYAIKNRDAFANRDHYLGGWHDPASGKVFLDVSVVKTNRKEAHALALAKDQIAYFDLETFESVTVNEKATSGGVA